MNADPEVLRGLSDTIANAIRLAKSRGLQKVEVGGSVKGWSEVLAALRASQKDGAEASGWSTDFKAANGRGDILAGVHSRFGAWRQGVVSYCDGIFWDWNFGEMPTHWRTLPEPPCASVDRSPQGGDAGGGSVHEGAAPIGETPSNSSPIQETGKGGGDA